jgi:hypothetical protein
MGRPILYWLTPQTEHIIKISVVMLRYKIIQFSLFKEKVREKA